jgi:hypothetical protein
MVGVDMKRMTDDAIHEEMHPMTSPIIKDNTSACSRLTARDYWHELSDLQQRRPH